MRCLNTKGKHFVDFIDQLIDYLIYNCASLTFWYCVMSPQLPHWVSRVFLSQTTLFRRCHSCKSDLNLLEVLICSSFQHHLSIILLPLLDQRTRRDWESGFPGYHTHPFQVLGEGLKVIWIGHWRLISDYPLGTWRIKKQNKKTTKKQQQKKTEQDHPFPDYFSHENLKNKRNSVILLLDHYRGHPRGQFGRKKSP